MKCKGCGVELQYEDPKKIGYSPKADALYCQRCYQLTHYGKLSYSFKEDVRSGSLFQKIASLNALIVWIVDLYDLESGFRQDITEFFRDKDVLMVCTKRDLLPESVGQEKLAKYLKMRLADKKVSVKGIVVIGEHGYDGKEEVLYAIDMLRKDRDVVLVGTTNAGKSTVLKNVFGMDDVTISRYPGTTMDLIEMPYEEYTLYDTPGFNQENSVQILADDKDMDYIVPKKKVKPQTFQLKSDQSLAVGGIMRIDIVGGSSTSATCYFAEKLPIHRGKISDADRLWKEHFGKLLVPTVNSTYFTKKTEYKKRYAKTDLVIVGLGWICVSGDYEKIVISGCDEAEVVIRKAMI
ncbi:MAG: ribosome biogenesis GTPase YqeH [Erysipelotrichaceae bacterium]|nr:ribosome biogenesis GTPase YqeH [Erysipelotrichaceae bacterium]